MAERTIELVAASPAPGHPGAKRAPGPLPSKSGHGSAAAPRMSQIELVEPVPPARSSIRMPRRSPAGPTGRRRPRCPRPLHPACHRSSWSSQSHTRPLVEQHCRDGVWQVRQGDAAPAVPGCRATYVTDRVGGFVVRPNGQGICRRRGVRASGGSKLAPSPERDRQGYSVFSTSGKWSSKHNWVVVASSMRVMLRVVAISRRPRLGNSRYGFVQVGRRFLFHPLDEMLDSKRRDERRRRQAYTETTNTGAMRAVSAGDQDQPAKRIDGVPLTPVSIASTAPSLGLRAIVSSAKPWRAEVT